MIRLDSRKLISWSLIFIPLALLLMQQSVGLFPFRENTLDATIFTVIMGVLMVAGYAYQERNPRDRMKKIIITSILFIGLPFIVGGMFALNDAVQGTTISGDKGYIFALDTIGSSVSDWTIIIQFIVGIIPAAVVVTGIIFIYMADTPDEYQTAIIETLLAIGMMVLAVLGLGWLGIRVF